MHFEYELTAEEYIEAVLAARPGNTSNHKPKVSRARRNVVRVIATTGCALAPVSILILAFTSRDQWTRPDFVDWAGRWEWLMPWTLLYGAALMSSFAARRSRAWVRAVSILVFAIGIGLGVAVIAASENAGHHALLNDFSMIRVLPWVLVGSNLARYFRYAWSNRLLKALFQSSRYGDGPGTVTLVDGGIDAASANGTMFVRWGFFRRVQLSAHCMFILGRDGGIYHIIPRRVIGDVAACKALVEVIESRLATDRGFEVPISAVRATPSPAERS